METLIKRAEQYCKDKNRGSGYFCFKGNAMKVKMNYFGNTGNYDHVFYADFLNGIFKIYVTTKS